MTIDEIYSYYNTTGVSALKDISSVQNVESDDEKSSETVGSVSAGGRDTYVSTISAQDTELRSENYNDIINQIRQAKAAKNSGEDAGSETAETAGEASASGTAESASASGASGGVSAGGAGSDSSDDDEEETTTIVVINGQKYLETTTTNSDGSTTVTRTPIGTADGSGVQTTDFSAAAEGVAL